MKIHLLFWVVMLCSDVEGYQWFRGPHDLKLAICDSLEVADHILYPYKISCEVIAFYICLDLLFIVKLASWSRWLHSTQSHCKKKAHISVNCIYSLYISVFWKEDEITVFKW